MLSEAGISKCYLLTIDKGILFTRLQYIYIYIQENPTKCLKKSTVFLGKKWPIINLLEPEFYI